MLSQLWKTIRMIMISTTNDFSGIRFRGPRKHSNLGDFAKNLKPLDKINDDYIANNLIDTLLDHHLIIADGPLILHSKFINTHMSHRLVTKKN